MMERTLKQIAIELLEKYKEEKTAVIWEYSGHIRDDEEELKREVEKYKEEIESLSEK